MSLLCTSLQINFCKCESGYNSPKGKSNKEELWDHLPVHPWHGLLPGSSGESCGFCCGSWFVFLWWLSHLPMEPSRSCATKCRITVYYLLEHNNSFSYNIKINFNWRQIYCLEHYCLNAYEVIHTSCIQNLNNKFFWHTLQKTPVLLILYDIIWLSMLHNPPAFSAALWPELIYFYLSHKYLKTPLKFIVLFFYEQAQSFP